MPGSDQWYGPGHAGPGRTRKRPRWLIPAGAAAAIVAIAVTLVLALSPSSPKTTTAGQTATPPVQSHSASAAASATPTVGDLQVSQFQVGDCLTGANMQLNEATPWPKLTQAVPCNQAHTAEVFLSNSSFWPAGGAYPGDKAIKDKATQGCDKAFQSYVGIAFSKSIYTWADIVPDASTWPNGDRSLHCVAWYGTTSQPAGVHLHSSVKGTAR